MISNLRLGWFLTIFCVSCILMFYQLQISRLYEQIRILELSQSKSNTILKESQENNKETINRDDDVVVIYNRVPKTGSTSFVGVAYDLCKKNNFHVLHINITANNHVLSLSNQYKFVQNITHWDSMKPALYHGHFAFLDFSRFGAKKPLFINIIRKPLDRLISYYYFLRYGDNFRPYLVRRKHGDTMTFNECVKRNQPDCDPNNMWLQVPFFCGHAANCWKAGNKWALTEAKKNLVNNYLLVGVTEELDDFIKMLELTIPRIFKGAVDHYLTSNKSHLRQTVQKEMPSEETVKKIQKTTVWQMENELYEFALDHFHFLKRQTLGDRPQKFIYEKIRPK
ncbi:hypothetical protein ILUMI_09442 [Ignelater luminosus]|uniref:Heparin sulfate O-sulfotransferase n=1 Tax=Ignelater luminosus TaxID=2038154 RepID=A0A8K0CZR7_IGNLU|nr:hypothetical protein ILUMI_09442 [Ignelater luminosus]